MQEHDILQGYEVKNWQYSPKLLTIFLVAAIINALGIFVIGRTNLLQAKACDGAFIGKVCNVLDAVYVGAKLWRGDNGYVVADYTRTEIKEDDVVWIDETNVGPKFQYPAGYFQVANPEDYASEDSNTLEPMTESDFSTGSNNIARNQPPPITFGPPPPPNNSLLKKKPVLPGTNRKPVKGKLPDSPLGGDIKAKKNRKNGDSPSKLPNLKDNTANNKNKKEKEEKEEKNPLENKTAKQSNPVKNKVNQKPLKDLADEIIEKIGKKQVDLKQSFIVQMKGEINENGRLNPNKSRFVRADGDKAMVEVGKRAIEAFGDSGWLNHLSTLGIKKTDITLAQNNEKFLIKLGSSFPNPQKAKTVASGLIGGKLLAIKNGLEKDVETLLKAAKISSEKNIVTINFDLDKAFVQKMIADKLTEHQAKKSKDKVKKNQPNGNAKNSNLQDKSAR